MIGAFKSIILRDEGATMVEYALMLGLVAIVAFMGVKELGRNLDHLFDAARDAVRNSLNQGHS